jgi:putative addiction module killer protein
LQLPTRLSSESPRVHHAARRRGGIGSATAFERAHRPRIDLGPGYRIYFTHADDAIVLLLGGDKGSQQRDITKAQRLASELDE